MSATPKIESVRLQPTVERTQAPNQYPVTLAEAKRVLRLGANSSYHDQEIQDAIGAATEQFEHRIDRVLIAAQFEWSADVFPDGPIMIPHEPTTSVIGITYDDPDGVEQTLDAGLYALNLGNRQIYRTDGKNWPATNRRQRAARVIYQAGYGQAVEVPKIFKRAILLAVARYFHDPAMEMTAEAKAYESIVAQFARTGYE